MYHAARTSPAQDSDFHAVGAGDNDHPAAFPRLGDNHSATPGGFGPVAYANAGLRWDDGLDAVTKVAAHPVSATDEIMGVAVVGKIEDAGMFQKTADNVSTRIFSLTPGKPGRRRQTPRIFKSIETPAWLAS